jgi:hypothetical protein
MKKRLIFIIIIIVCISAVQAQKEALLQNKNIVWAKEATRDFAFEAYMGPEIDLGYNSLLKYINPISKDNRKEMTILNHVFNDFAKNKKLFFKDADCKTPFSDEDFTAVRDTISYTDETTKEKITQIQTYNFDRDHIVAFRAKQIYYYDTQKAKFGVMPLAVAPLMQNQITAGNDTINKYRPIFWIKATELEKDLDVEEKNVTWAASITNGNHYLFNDSLTKSYKFLKNQVLTPQKSYIEHLKAHQEIPIYKTMDLDEKFPNVGLLLTRPAEDIEINDVSLMESLVPEGDIREFEGLTTIQKWYWDSTKKQLSCYLEGVGLNHVDISSNIRYNHGYALFFTKQ